ncbi:MAG TPA: sigma-70 family RNA polymerase sigma factor [Steroidobacteraceae bacterium]|jgi:RNA polymerase sigma-70 factor (ECF subfamily)
MQSASSDAAAQDRAIVTLLQDDRLDDAFERLLERYQNKVYRLCCSILRDTTAAEDAAQESLVRVWKALSGYDQRASLSTWIYTITRNRCLSALERRRELASLSDATIEAQVHSLAAPEREPDDRLEMLRELVDALPERYRRIVTLFYYEDRSVSEVASMLGMPEGTVKTTLFRARAALLEQLRRRGLADAGLWLENAR